MGQGVLLPEGVQVDAGSRSTSTRTVGSGTNGWTRRFLSIDPGAVHVGIARFERENGTLPWKCRFAKEVDVPGMIAYLVSACDEGLFDEVVIERFIISLKMMQAQARRTGRDFEAMSQDAVDTIECVGAVRVLCAMGRVPLVKQTPRRQQDALTERARVGLGEELLLSKNPHARSAELHGWYRVLSHRGGGWRPGAGLTTGQRVW